MFWAKRYWIRLHINKVIKPVYLIFILLCIA